MLRTCFLHWIYPTTQNIIIHKCSCWRKPKFQLIIQEARAAGCRTSAEADRYLELKRGREAEEASRRAKEGGHAGASSQGGANVFMASESLGKDSNSRPSGQASSSHVNDLYIMGFNETQLLSEAVSF